MKLADDVIQVLADSVTTGDQLTLPGYLSRELYVKVDKAIQSLGGKWNRKAKAHVFSGQEASSLVSELVANGEMTDLKKDYNFFPTPVDVAKFVVDLAQFTEEGLSVLEPSAGRGGLINELPDDCIISCVELQADNCEHLRSMGLTPIEGDFLLLEPNKDLPLFDRIVLNPPFAKFQDVAHVLHALRFLKPGGRLVAITSPSWQYVQTKKADAFRHLVKTANCTVHELAPGAFKESGTMIRTVVLEFQN